MKINLNYYPSNLQELESNIDLCYKILSSLLRFREEFVSRISDSKNSVEHLDIYIDEMDKAESNRDSN